MTTVPAVRRDAATEAFFDGTGRGELLIRHCAACGGHAAPQESSCPACGDAQLSWVPALGTGTLVSWTATQPRSKDGSPTPRTTIGLVELTEGPWLYARIAGVEDGAPSSGLSVTVEFGRPADGDGEAVPVFRPGL
uniref:OB-fold domain-containing protein n=1 Tax=Streptomyces sp. NBC_00148 TaxID=2903626 RepID=A0AAU1M317_9ACTN